MFSTNTCKQWKSHQELYPLNVSYSERMVVNLSTKPTGWTPSHVFCRELATMHDMNSHTCVRFLNHLNFKVFHNGRERQQLMQ